MTCAKYWSWKAYTEFTTQNPMGQSKSQRTTVPTDVELQKSSTPPYWRYAN